jgi:hypothetical protein
MQSSTSSAHACKPPARSSTLSSPLSRNCAAAIAESLPLRHSTTTCVPSPNARCRSRTSAARRTTCSYACIGAHLRAARGPCAAGQALCSRQRGAGGNRAPPQGHMHCAAARGGHRVTAHLPHGHMHGPGQPSRLIELLRPNINEQNRAGPASLRSWQRPPPDCCSRGGASQHACKLAG